MNTNSLKTTSHRNLISLTGFRSGIAIVFSFFVFVSIASAANYYVATTGSDSYTVTQAKNSATPWKTIQKAANNVAAGDTVHVASGTYVIPTTGITSNTSGTASAHITFISDVKWGAKLQSTPGTQEVLWAINGNYIDIKNFEVTRGSYGLYAAGSNIKIIGNKIHDVTGSGAATETNGYNNANVDFIGNIIYNAGSGFLDHGIYASSNGGIISNNIIYNVSGYGIHSWHGARNYTFSNNLIWGCAGGGIIVGSGDTGANVADNFIVTNNIVINNGYYGIEEHSGATGAIGANNVYKNNIVNGNKSGAFSLEKNTHQNTITTDPKLVNFKLDGTGDYHLSATSPAIQAGATQGAPRDDFDGLIRMGSTYIGPLILVPPSNLKVVPQ